ncbi:response regulator transcription factor [Aromatoleum bremense]|uniref:Response regulator n=1 Tax=Aromatoleum bremense TaxID=76115 RepID=A0ABX1NYJ3_9RHOO|nr:response regulator [Aromatoleum bremense]NMG17037.1 response regulator [Aromatoleum bremense]
MDTSTVQVFLVDDEPDVLEGLVWLLDSIKVPSRVFTSGEAFLRAVAHAHGPVCAVLDLRMPGMSGLELQKKLVDLGRDIPLFFLTAHGDVPAAVNAMQMGAVTFLQKPFNAQEFLDAINRILRQAADDYADRQRKAQFRQRLARLSAREIEILEAITKGFTSKEIARIYAISPKTVDVHRANVLRKMDVANAAELQRLVSDFGVPSGTKKAGP